MNRIIANYCKPFTQPMAGLWGPKLLVINERADSGGDLFPYHGTNFNPPTCSIHRSIEPAAAPG